MLSRSLTLCTQLSVCLSVCLRTSLCFPFLIPVRLQTCLLRPNYTRCQTNSIARLSLCSPVCLDFRIDKWMDGWMDRCRFFFLSIFQFPRAHLHVVGMLRFMSDINQPSLPTPFCSVLVSVSVFMALSTLFHSLNSPDNSPFSHSVLPVLSLPYWFLWT